MHDFACEHFCNSEGGGGGGAAILYEDPSKQWTVNSCLMPVKHYCRPWVPSLQG